MSESKGLLIPDAVLKGYGCKSCVWKSYGQCPQGFTKVEETTDIGYCDEFADFLFSLAEGEDSISALKEKFMLYTQEMESMADHMKLKELQAKYLQAKSQGYSDSECKDLLIGIQMYKQWWARLTDSVIKGLGRIADRERRSKDVATGGGKITVQQLNVLLKESDTVLNIGDNR